MLEHYYNNFYHAFACFRKLESFSFYSVKDSNPNDFFLCSLERNLTSSSLHNFIFEWTVPHIFICDIFQLKKSLKSLNVIVYIF